MSPCTACATVLADIMTLRTRTSPAGKGGGERHKSYGPSLQMRASSPIVRMHATLALGNCER
eukprot:1894827-Pleurochrysis_carterae.AAC.3